MEQRRETTTMAECSVSLWTSGPASRMNDNTHCSPPASNTAPASRVQINSNTCPARPHEKHQTFQNQWTVIAIPSFRYRPLLAS